MTFELRGARTQQQAEFFQVLLFHKDYYCMVLLAFQKHIYTKDSCKKHLPSELEKRNPICI